MGKRAAAVLVALACAPGATAAISPSQASRLTAAAKVVRDVETIIPADDWSRAECVVVIPELRKAAFLAGGEDGRGVMSCRAGERWSAPLFLQMARGSWGFQAGAQQIDLVLLVMNESGVQKLLQNKVTLGADAAIARGPIGRQAAAATDAQVKAEILSYSRAEGLFAGIDLTGGILKPDDDANTDAYGAKASPRTILAAGELSAPTEAAPLLQALSTPPAASDTRPRAGAAPRVAVEAGAVLQAPTADGELRVRIAAMQQTVDRMLESSRPVPVGTSGASAAGDAAALLVSVERQQLVQLRQQLDELMRLVGSR